MYQFFYIRKSAKDKTIGTIYEAVFDDRTPIRRVSLKIIIPLKLWDDKNQRVKESEIVPFAQYNHTINQLRLEFLQSNETAPKLNKDCFVAFAMDVLDKDYSNPETRKKYRTILNSLLQYSNEELKLKTLPVDTLRKLDFIKGYTKWLEQRQYIGRKNEIKKKNKTILNYLVVIRTFVKEYNEQNPQLDEIKTIHYKTNVGKIDKVESRMLYPHEVDKLINYEPVQYQVRDKTLDAKYHFLFQFFTCGLRVSDILLLNYKHFTNGRIEFVVKKNGEKISVPFGYKSCKILSHFYPDEYNQAMEQNQLGNYPLSKTELDEYIVINSKKELGSLTIDDLHRLERHLKDDKTHDNSKRIKVITGVIKRVEKGVSETMCSIVGSKPSGLVFDYLKNEEFKNIKIVDERILNDEQINILHRARCTYNSRLKRIAGDIGVEKLTSHVSRHSFAYYMLSSGATVEEISHALNHSSIEQTQNYLKQFPSKYSDNAIERFGDGWEI